MIGVSSNPIIPFTILSSLTISSTCFESHLTSRTKIVRISSKSVFIFTVEKNQFFSGVHISKIHLDLLLLQIFLNSPIQ